VSFLERLAEEDFARAEGTWESCLAFADLPARVRASVLFARGNRDLQFRAAFIAMLDLLGPGTGRHRNVVEVARFFPGGLSPHTAFGWNSAPRSSPMDPNERLRIIEAFLWHHAPECLGAAE
jgi:hypothetical protein